jgi:hypothetical protein
VSTAAAYCGSVMTTIRKTCSSEESKNALAAETCGLISSDCKRATFKTVTAVMFRLQSSGSSDVTGIAKSYRMALLTF